VKIIITSGYYNCITSSHIQYLESAKLLGDLHLAIVNNDKQVNIKGSCPFQDENERLSIVKALKCVDYSYLSIDSDGSVSETIQNLVNYYGQVYGIMDTILGKKQEIEWIFAKGGDRKSRKTLPKQELEVLDSNNINIVFGVGGKTKEKSSSDSLLKCAEWYVYNHPKFDDLRS
jgi:cytidyltransferase-like protein